MNYEEFLKYIMPKIEEHFIQNGRGMVVLQGYEWYRDIMTLYAKQHNLVEAVLVLLDNNMCEEAFVLSRTILNNYFLIGYLINDKDGSRIKEYHVQPLLNQRKLLKEMKKMLEGSYGKKLIEKGEKYPASIDELKNKIQKLGAEIIERGFTVNKAPLSVAQLAKNNGERGYQFYVLWYSEASSYEHSDISSLEIYKKSVDDLDKNAAFIMDLDSTDEKLREKVHGVLSVCYLDSFQNLIDLLKGREAHLQINYNIEKLSEIVIEITAFLKMNEEKK